MRYIDGVVKIKMPKKVLGRFWEQWRLIGFSRALKWDRFGYLLNCNPKVGNCVVASLGKLKIQICTVHIVHSS